MRLERDWLIVTYDPSRTTVADLVATVKQSGYSATVVDPDEPPHMAPAPQEAADVDLPALFTKALARARQSRKPLVLDFQAQWCVPCKRMERETFTDPGVVRLLQQCVLLKIDTDEHPALAKHFGVVGLPDLRLLAPDGKERKRLNGFQDAASFEIELKNLIESVNEKPERNLPPVDDRSTNRPEK